MKENDVFDVLVEHEILNSSLWKWRMKFPLLIGFENFDIRENMLVCVCRRGEPQDSWVEHLHLLNYSKRRSSSCLIEYLYFLKV